MFGGVWMLGPHCRPNICFFCCMKHRFCAHVSCFHSLVVSVIFNFWIVSAFFIHSHSVDKWFWPSRSPGPPPPPFILLLLLSHHHYHHLSHLLALLFVRFTHVAVVSLRLRPIRRVPASQPLGAWSDPIIQSPVLEGLILILPDVLLFSLSWSLCYFLFFLDVTSFSQKFLIFQSIQFRINFTWYFCWFYSCLSLRLKIET